MTKKLTTAQLAAVFFGVSGLILGVTAAVTSTTALGIAAGGAALAAGIACMATQPQETLVLTSPKSERSGLYDPESGLLTGDLFELLVDVRITTAKRYLRPLAVVQFEVTANKFGHTTVAAITASLRHTLRDCDSPCRVAKQTFGVILEDTPETGAVWAIERVRRHLQNQIPDAVLRAGIACYPAHSINSEGVLQLARHAMHRAKEWPQDRIEVAVAD